MLTYQLEADEVSADPDWRRIRIWQDFHGAPEVKDLYELGEPVRIKSPTNGLPADHVYWILSFKSHPGRIQLGPREPGSPQPPDAVDDWIYALPNELRKLPEMLRIAVEASREFS